MSILSLNSPSKMSSPTWSLYSAIKPMYYVSKTLGLAPIQYVGKHSVRSSRMAVVYACFLGVVHIVCCILYFSWSYLTFTESDVDAKIVVTDVVNTVIMYGSVLGALGVSAWLHGNKLREILARISTVDRILYTDLDRTYSRTYYFLLLELGVVFLWYGLYIIYDGITLQALDIDLSPLDWILGFVLGIYPLLFNIVMVVQYINLVLVLKFRFKRINEYLQDRLTVLQREQTVDNIILESVQSEVQKMELRERKNGHLIKEGLVKDFVTIPSTLNEDKETLDILTLRRSFDILSEVVVLINTSYGFHILLEMIYLFLSMVSSIYSVIMTTFVSFAHWMAMNILLILCIAVSCHLTTAEGRHTAVLVNRLLLERRGSSHEQLKLFSHQLLHARVQLTACGFFFIDCSLLCGMIGAITTYIVILIQYQAPAPPA